MRPLLTRDFFVGRILRLEGYILICRKTLNLYGGKVRQVRFERKLFHGAFCSKGAVQRYCPERKMCCGKFYSNRGGNSMEMRPNLPPLYSSRSMTEARSVLTSPPLMSMPLFLPIASRISHDCISEISSSL